MREPGPHERTAAIKPLGRVGAAVMERPRSYLAHRGTHRAAAAVARINLDNAPTKETLKRLQASNTDIIELDLLDLK